jgi:hypothetical protein
MRSAVRKDRALNVVPDVSTLLSSLVAAGIGHAIAFYVIQDARQHQSVQAAASSPTRPSKQVDQPKAPTLAAAKNPRQGIDSSSSRNAREREAVTPPASAPIYAASALKERIDSAKSRARTLEICAMILDGKN